MIKRLLLSLLIITLGFSTFSFAPQPAEAGYKVGDIFSVPITYTGNDLVVAADLVIGVTNGELVSIQCGGSGFVVVLASGNRCLLIHVAPGLSSGTLATVQVKGTVPGTLVVNPTAGPTGALKNVLSLPVTGTITGGNFAIEQQSTPTPSPSSSSTPTPSPSSSNSPSSSPSNSASSSPTTTVSARATSSSTGDSITKTVESGAGNLISNTIVVSPNKIIPKSASANGGGSTATRPASGDVGDQTVITPAITATKMPIAIEKEGEVIVAAGALRASFNEPIDITLPEGDDTWINFQAYMAPGSSKPYAVLPQAMTLHKWVGQEEVVISLPKDLIIMPTDSTDAVLQWNGMVLAPYFIEDSDRFRHQLVLTIGDTATGMSFNQAVKITFQEKRRWSAAWRSHGDEELIKINTQCAKDISKTEQLPFHTECWQQDGEALVVWTNHFTQFSAYYPTSFVWILSIVAGVLIFAILFLIFRRYHYSLRHPAVRARKSIHKH